MSNRDEQKLLTKEETLRDIAGTIREACPPGVSFALFLMNDGPDGFTTYASNVPREQMIKVITETLAHLQTGAVAPHGQPEHPANKRGEG